ncbi:hypothetical protein BRADI_1g56820v3 [Brachypodium distachyon]|uniref:Uncharacterized protein n=1 Tax=Brachypodium distachyon TaxID=15368 RepID=A0A2K2DRU8_BRADI|nr:hypothetical protein BRADI_1g56820v3 [Brachypodium distachyon]
MADDIWYYHEFLASTSRGPILRTNVKCLGELLVSSPSFRKQKEIRWPTTDHVWYYHEFLASHFTRHYPKGYCEMFGGTLGVTKLSQTKEIHWPATDHFWYYHEFLCKHFTYEALSQGLL